MAQIRILLALPLLFLFVGCSGKKDKSNTDNTTAEVTTIEEDQYRDRAADWCACMRPLADMYKKIKELSAAGNVDELSTLMDELETATEEAETCTDRLEEKYGAPDDEAAFLARFRQECPQVAALITEMDEAE